MPRGPLPNPNRRRQNAATIPSTALPAAGRKGEAPKVPSQVTLGRAGRAWWRWAWRTPQATAWDDGALQVVARRASLEDDLAAIGEVDSLGLAGLLDAEDARRFKQLISRLAGLATGRLKIMQEMRELDRALGLTPKAMADLRWKIVGDEAKQAAPEKPATVRRLRAVDPDAVAGA